MKKENEYACSEFTVDKDVVERVSAEMLEEESYQQLSLFFKAIADQTRIKILHALSKSTLCVCEIATLLNMTVSAISHQLRLLKQARLVRYEKRGRVVYYSLNDDHVNLVFNNAMEHIME